MFIMTHSCTRASRVGGTPSVADTVLFADAPNLGGAISIYICGELLSCSDGVSLRVVSSPCYMCRCYAYLVMVLAASDDTSRSVERHGY